MLCSLHTGSVRSQRAKACAYAVLCATGLVSSNHRGCSRRRGAPRPPKKAFRVQPSTTEPKRRAVGPKFAPKGPFETRRRNETLENRCVEARPNALFTCTSLRSEKSHTFDPPPKRPRGPFRGVVLCRNVSQEGQNASFFRSRARFGPKRPKSKKVHFGAPKGAPGRTKMFDFGDPRILFEEGCGNTMFLKSTKCDFR